MNIIEFAGLTGCGKSTLCSVLVSSLKGSKIIQYKDVFTKLKLKKLIVPFYRIRKEYGRFDTALEKFASLYDGVSENALDKLRVLFITALNVDKNAFMILDEGFVQFITSLAHLHTIDGGEELNALIGVINSSIVVLL